MVDPYSHPFPPYTPPNDTNRKVNGSYGWSRSHAANHGSFDTNMVIILAALLCALICTLGLNSIIRFFLRISRRYPVEIPDEDVRLPETGLKKRALHQIPVEVYGSGISIPATDCPICLGEFMEGEKLRVLPECNHGFHVKCIDTWLVSHSSCPTCRHSLLETSLEGAHIDDGLVGGEVVVIVDDMS